MVDLEQHPDAVNDLKARGLLQAPVVITDTDAWTGFRPDKIATLAA